MENITYTPETYQEEPGFSPEEQTSEGQNRFSWETLSRLMVYLLVGLTPLWFLPVTVFPLELNKAYLGYMLIIASFVFWLLARIQEGRMRLPKNFIALALISLVVAVFLSGLFSISRHVSFFGLGHEEGTVGAFTLFSLAALVTSLLFTEHKHAKNLFRVFMLSAGVVFIFQVLHSILGIDIFSQTVFTASASNLIGSWNAFGIFWGLAGIIALFLSDSPDGKWRWYFYAVAMAGLLALIAVNFNVAWWLFAAFTVAFLAYLFSFGNGIKALGWLPVLALLISLLFIITPTLGQTISEVIGVTALDVRPNLQSSWQVIQKTLEDNIFLGSGPNTFLYDWMKFKPLDVNTTPFWAVRFNSGIAFLPSLVATTGLAGVIALAFLIISFLWYGLRSMFTQTEKSEGSFMTLSLITVLYLLLAEMLYTPGFLLTLFLFVFLGVFMGHTTRHGLTGEYSFALFKNSGVGFVSVLLLLALSLASISGLYFLGQKYAAAIFYGQAIRSFNIDGNIDAARQSLTTAWNLDRQDLYARSLVDINLARLGQVINNTNLPPDELRTRFQDALNETIQNGQLATQLNSVDPANWLAFGRIYEAVIPFNISGAADLAADAYKNAETYNPTSPEPLLAEARIEAARNDLPKARELLVRANNIKSDYVASRFLLAQVEATTGNLDAALIETQNALFLAPNDIGILFQLGLLFYQDGQYDNSQLVLERAVEINSSYSNARYFLGLIYDRKGDTPRALGEFEKISELNPNNNEVKIIIANLKDNRPALQGIAPPPPEERKTPPVNSSSER